MQAHTCAEWMRAYLVWKESLTLPLKMTASCPDVFLGNSWKMKDMIAWHSDILLAHMVPHYSYPVQDRAHQRNSTVSTWTTRHMPSAAQMIADLGMLANLHSFSQEQPVDVHTVFLCWCWVCVQLCAIMLIQTYSKPWTVSKVCKLFKGWFYHQFPWLSGIWNCASWILL